MTPESAKRSRLSRRAALLGGLLVSFTLAGLFPASASAIYVYIDPGHGGRYSNANANGLREKNVNLSIGLYLRYYLKAQGHRVGMTRTTDRAVGLADRATWQWSGSRAYYAKDGRTGYAGGIPKDDLQARVDKANRAGADLFVSIHNNGSANRGARGTENYAATFDSGGRSLGRYAQTEVVRATGLRNRGHFTANFYVLRWSNMPAILVEGAFISNPRDARLLRNPYFRKRIARGIAAGIRRWLATRPYPAIYGRVAGPTAAGTDVAVSQRFWPGESPEVVLFPRTASAHALAAVPLAHDLDAPMFGVDGDVIPPEVVAELGRLKPDRVTVIGYPGALEETIVAQAARASSIPAGSVRTFGGDPYETAAAIAREMGPGDNGQIVVCSASVPDAAAASEFAAKREVPILLVESDMVPPATAAFVLDHKIDRTYVLGGLDRVSAFTMAAFPYPLRIWYTAPSRFSPASTAVAAARKSYPTGTVRPVVANIDRFPDALLGGRMAAKLKRPLLLTKGRVMPERVREYIENEDWRISGFFLVGSTANLPRPVERQLRKADHY